MKRIHTDEAPAAIGPYSQAVRSGRWLFTAGQIALVPETGELVGGGIEAQTRQALANLQAVLAADGCDPDRVVKTTLFLTDLTDFPLVNEIYGEFFGDHRPARSTVGVSQLPKGALVEIEAVARRQT